MSNPFTLQVSRLGKSSSMKNNLGLSSETPTSFLDSPLKPLKAFPKGLLDLKKVLNTNTLTAETAQTQATQRSKRESRFGLRNKTEEKRKIEVNVPSTGKLSDKGSEYTNERDSATKDLKNLHLDNFDYASLLMYFPDNGQTQSARPSKKAFNSFKELVKTSRGGYEELLDDIVKDSRLKKRPLAAIQKEMDQIEVVKKVLEYNKSQKNQYTRAMATQTQNMFLPVIKQSQQRTKKPLKIKIMPSKKLDDKGATFEVIKEFKNSMNPDEILNNIHQNKSTPSSPLHRRRDSKVRRASIQRLDDKVYERIFSVYNYKIFWSHDFTNSSTWKPGVREGHTFTTVGKYVVLYGGVSNALLEDIVFYDPTRNMWVKPKVTGEIPMNGRHGHTACEFKRNLIIFGGEQHFNATLNIRECLNDVRMFTPETNEWKYVRVLSHSITPRRYHAAALHDHTMFVYGGINNEGVYMKDVWTFSLRSYIWTKAEIPGEREPGIAFHTMTACFAEKIALNSKEKEKTHTYEEGIYVFGGKDGEGTILNSLKMFSADVKNTQWKYPTIKGTPPVARYNHSALFYEPLGLLVIYGGKNETLFGTTYDVCLNDIKILHLEQMTWAETTSHGHRPQVGRYHHAVAAFGTKMLIFGGVELYQYADEEVKFVELNQVKARRLIETDEYTETAGNRRKSQPGMLAGLMGDKEAFANEEFQAFEEFYSKDIVSFQPVPQAQMNYPEGEKEIRLKLIENIQQREKFSDSPRHRVFKRFNTFLVEE